MKKPLPQLKRVAAVSLLVLAGLGAKAQTFWTDDFENTGSPSGSSIRTPSISYTNGSSYFNRINKNSPGISFYNLAAYTNVTGDYYWAGQDQDDANTKQPEQSITWTEIDIAGRTNIQFKGKFAFNNDSDAWENQQYPGSTFSHTDYIILEYAIDNSTTFTPLIHFKPEDITAGTGKRLSRDVDFNGIGDGAAFRPSKAFAYFTQSISVSGTKLKLRLRVYSNGTPEEWAIDDFSLTQLNPLPVKLSDFSASKLNNGVKLKWQTTSETNSSHFQILRSANGKDFSELGQVASAANANLGAIYGFNDPLPLAGTNYYRLVQVDLNGTKIEVGQTAVDFGLSDKVVVTYPNPVKDKLSVVFPQQAKTLTLATIDGKICYQLDLKAGTLQLSIPTESLSRGTYVLRTVMADGSVSSKTIIKP
ncbi:T9SS type A sorting domain-containing protein [Pedobacter sp.]